MDEERAAVDDEDDLKERHKALVRAAGRAAIEDTLNQRQNAELTAESLAAEWLAYAEVFGTNGMAAGSARLSAPDANAELPAADEARDEPPSPSWRKNTAAVAVAVGIVAVVLCRLIAQPQARAR